MGLNRDRWNPDRMTVSWWPLAKLIEKENFKRIVEVGVYGGALTRHILTECKDVIEEYWAVDPWASYEQMKGDWDDLYKRVCSYMVCYSQLKVLRLTSKEAASLFPEQYFDLVFIDANHSYEFIKEDIYLWKPLIRKGGILSGHDYKAGGKFPFWGVKTAVDEIFNQEKIEQMRHKIFLVRM